MCHCGTWVCFDESDKRGRFRQVWAGNGRFGPVGNGFVLREIRLELFGALWHSLARERAVMLDCIVACDWILECIFSLLFSNYLSFI